jgi:hypothetical protein
VCEALRASRPTRRLGTGTAGPQHPGHERWNWLEASPGKDGPPPWVSSRNPPNRCTWGFSYFIGPPVKT